MREVWGSKRPRWRQHFPATKPSTAVSKAAGQNRPGNKSVKRKSLPDVAQQQTKTTPQPYPRDPRSQHSTQVSSHGKTEDNPNRCLQPHVAVAIVFNRGKQTDERNHRRQRRPLGFVLVETERVNQYRHEQNSAADAE